MRIPLMLSFALALAAASARAGDDFAARVTTTKPDVPEDWDEKPVWPAGYIAVPGDDYVAVNRDTHTVLVAVSLSDGMNGVQAQLEFLAISGQKNLDGHVMYERGYESVFTTRARPDPIFLACMLAGFTPGDMPMAVPEGEGVNNNHLIEGEIIENTRPAVPAERVALTIEWDAGGETRNIPVAAFLYDQATKKAMAGTPWLFTGSFMVNHPTRGQTLAASLTQVLAATYYDTSALFNLPFLTANVYNTDDSGIILDAESLPPDFRYVETITEGISRRRIWLPLRRRAFLKIAKAEGPAAE